MKIALINGSPRARSTSGYALEKLKENLSSKGEIVEFNLISNPLTVTDVDDMSDCDAIVISSPLFFDALPSHVVSALITIENNLPMFKNSPEVFAISNGGFTEADNSAKSFSVISNWCRKCGFKWKYGIGIGSGWRLILSKDISLKKIGLNSNSIIGQIALTICSFEPKLISRFRKKGFNNSIKKLAFDITESGTSENVYVRPFFPKSFFLSYIMTNATYFVGLKMNGCKLRDICKKDI